MRLTLAIAMFTLSVNICEIITYVLPNKLIRIFNLENEGQGY